MINHSTLPWWTENIDGYTRLVNATLVMGNFGMGEQGKVDAEFIAKACNEYEKLTKELEETREEIRSLNEQMENMQVEYGEALDRYMCDDD